MRFDVCGQGIERGSDSLHERFHGHVPNHEIVEATRWRNQLGFDTERALPPKTGVSGVPACIQC
jgi:hypothetical protein